MKIFNEVHPHPLFNSTVKFKVTHKFSFPYLPTCVSMPTYHKKDYIAKFPFDLNHESRKMQNSF